MYSEKKYFNKTLFKKNITGCWPLWAVTSFFGAVLVFGVITSMGLWFGMTPNVNLSFKNAYAAGVLVNPVISMLYALLCAFFSWKYMFREKSSSFMHSLPIKREGIFLTNCLSGFIIMNIPYAVVGLAMIISNIVFGEFYFGNIILTIIYVLGENLFFFSFATLVAFITGNGFAMSVIYLAGNFIAALLEVVITGLASGFLYGVNTLSNGYFNSLSPVVKMIQTMHLTEGNGLIEGGWILAVYAAIGILFVFISLLIYKKRKIETAGEVITVGWLRALFKYAVALAFAIVGGRFIYGIIFFRYAASIYRFVPLLICVIVMGLIGLMAAEMLLRKSIKIFRKRLFAEMAALCVLLFAFCAIFRFDLFGAENRIASRDEIKTLSVKFEDVEFELGKDDESQLDTIIGIHQYIIDNKAELKEQEAYDIFSIISDSYSYDVYYAPEVLSLTYNLKNGNSFERTYDLHGLKEYVERAREMFSDNGIKEKLLFDRGWNADDVFISGDVYYYSDSYYQIYAYDYPLIMDALKKDINDYKIGICETQERNKDFYLHLDMRKYERGEYKYNNISILINDKMTNLMKVLSEKGYMDLIYPDNT